MNSINNRFLFFLVLLLLGNSLLQAQPKPPADSARNSASDSTQRIAEAYLLQQQEQQRIDSLISLRLQAELDGANTNGARRKALEDSLRQLSRREAQRKEDQLARISALKQNAVAHPVVLQKDTLFYIYTRTGSFTAAERASAISRRVQNLYDDAFFDADSLTVAHNEATYDIVYKRDNIIMSVSELDALWFSTPADTIANRYLHTIQTVVAADRDANSFVSWLLRIVYTILIIAGIWLIIYGVNYLFSRLSVLLKTERDTYFKGFTVRKVQVLSPSQHYLLAVRAVNGLRIIVIILAIYLALPLLFAVFPQTEALANVLWGWIITPAKAVVKGLVDFLPNLFTIVVVYFATRYLLKIVHYFISEISKGAIQLPGFYKDWAWPTFNVVRFLAYALMF
ncbi:MAG: cell envelope integrity protein TolA, partial [Williamsia sp.]|nr:cell envelope integrity protein TolA [Williamsia sp.]